MKQWKTKFVKGLTIFLIAIITFVPFIPKGSEAATVTKIYANEFLDAKKQIDYLGDGQTNPDTKLQGEDFYRLYLDVVGTSVYPAMDVVLVIDNSASMGTYNMGWDKRITALNKVLEGTSGQKGMIDEIYDLNPDNQISLVKFNGWSEKLTSWMGKDQVRALKAKIPRSTPSTWDSNRGGTNTEQGMWWAQNLLEDRSVKNNGHEKIVIVLSDGVPTHYMTPGGWFNGNRIDTFEGSGSRKGTGQISPNNMRACVQPTINAATIFKRNHSEMTLNSIFIANRGDYSTNKNLLDNMASTPNYSYSAENINELIESFRKSIGIMEDVTITDELSAYVDYYNNQADIKITKTNQNGNVTTLAPSQYTINQPNWWNPKKVSATIKGGLEIGATYTLSFNVKTTEKAKQAVDTTKNGTAYYGPAGILGDKNTDYQTNKTSSQQPGLPSNVKATVTWNRIERNGSTANYEYVYDHPVVQVKVPEVDAEGSIKKQIDYLGDDVANSDTLVNGKNDYRLYLNVRSTGKASGAKINPLENVVIKDTLSKYVNYVDTKADVKVTAESNGVTVPIAPAKYTYQYDSNSKTMQVKFVDPMPENSVYTVSYNVSVSDAATAEYDRNLFMGNEGYNGVKGETDTDYLANKTSSNQFGFRSNEKASATWSVSDNQKEMTYMHPVVQVTKGE